MLNPNIIKAFNLALALFFSYLVSMGTIDLITFQIQTDTLSTSELLDSLYLILNSLFFVLTLVLIRLFIDERQIENLN